MTREEYEAEKERLREARDFAKINLLEYRELWHKRHHLATKVEADRIKLAIRKFEAEFTEARDALAMWINNPSGSIREPIREQPKPHRYEAEF